MIGYFGDHIRKLKPVTFIQSGHSHDVRAVLSIATGEVDIKLDGDFDTS